MSARVLEHPALQAVVKRARYRLLSLEFLEPEGKRARPAKPHRYRAVIYDYTNGRTILADGRVGARDDLEIRESGIQPVPGGAEFVEAVEAPQAKKRGGSL